MDKTSEENGNPSTSKRQASEDASADLDADDEPAADSNPDAQPRAGTNTNSNSNSSKKRKSTASTKKTTAKRTKAGTPRTTAENEELISFLSTHEHGKRITTLDGTTIPEAIQVILAETVKEWDEHDQKQSWDTCSLRFMKRCVRSHINNSKNNEWSGSDDPSPTLPAKSVRAIAIMCTGLMVPGKGDFQPEACTCRISRKRID